MNARKTGHAVVLVGHGGVPSDYPREHLRRLMMLERERRESGLAASAEEQTLERQLRHHPRTPDTDPYQAGLERVGRALQAKLGATPLFLAYNEFCAPTLEEAAESAMAAGAARVTFVTTMLTPGGSHAEREIPELIALLRHKHPGVEFHYAWPVPVDALAEFLRQCLPS